MHAISYLIASFGFYAAADFPIVFYPLDGFVYPQSLLHNMQPRQNAKKPYGHVQLTAVSVKHFLSS
jgi:hypothetical protein